MELPRGYNARLARFDRLLRMRWSDAQECWLLERKLAAARLDLDPALLPEDTRAQYAEGYFTLGVYEPRALPAIDNLIRGLEWADTWKMGMTSDQIADYMDDRETIARASRSVAFSRDMHDLGGEAFDEYARLTGARSFANSDAARRAA